MLKDNKSIEIKMIREDSIIKCNSIKQIKVQKMIQDISKFKEITIFLINKN